VRSRTPPHVSALPLAHTLNPPHTAELGDLDRVEKIVKLTAFVNCVDSFQAQPKVVNGCSDLFANAFGDAGRHSRSAVGVNALPLNVPVEIEAIVLIKVSEI
jgi:enamine deaminase RidA (YjgF/YER057c/UK114 family)